MKVIVIQTTCLNEKEAKKLSRVLVEKKLAACVQILPINSYYIWENRLCNDNEVLLNIKTRKSNFKTISKFILENHSYDVPEIVVFEINMISKDYKNFIKKNSKKQ